MTAESYVPTLGEYAEIIHWLVAHPNEEIPKDMRRAFDDAIDRAELRKFTRALVHMHDPFNLVDEWRLRGLDALLDPPCVAPETVRGPSPTYVVFDEIHDWVPYPESIVMGLHSSRCGSCNNELPPLGEDFVCPHCAIDFHFLRPDPYEQMTESDLDAMQDVADATGLQLIR